MDTEEFYWAARRDDGELAEIGDAEMDYALRPPHLYEGEYLVTIVPRRGKYHLFGYNTKDRYKAPYPDGDYVFDTLEEAKTAGMVLTRMKAL